MTILHELQVISNFHHDDVFFFVLRPDTNIIAMQSRKNMIRHTTILHGIFAFG